MRAELAVLSLVLVLQPGCAPLQPRLAADRCGVEPLCEAEFDRFASRLADEITDVLDQHDYWPPAIIELPRLQPGAVEDPAVADGFARRLAEGLNDRLRRAALFTSSGFRRPDLRCTLSFVSSPDDPSHRMIVFRLVDEESGRERLRAVCAYQAPRPARQAPPVPRP